MGWGGGAAAASGGGGGGGSIGSLEGWGGCGVDLALSTISTNAAGLEFGLGLGLATSTNTDGEALAETDAAQVFDDGQVILAACIVAGVLVTPCDAARNEGSANEGNAIEGRPSETCRNEGGLTAGTLRHVNGPSMGGCCSLAVRTDFGSTSGLGLGSGLKCRTAGGCRSVARPCWAAGSLPSLAHHLAVSHW